MLGHQFIKKDIISEYLQQIQMLKQEIAEATEFVNQLRQDSNNASYQGDFNKPESLISSLLKMQAEIQKLAENEKQQNWVTTGLAKFSELMRDNFDSQRKMGDEMLSEIVPYVNANQGGLFLIHEEEDEYTTLELVASYAYNRKKFIQKFIRIEYDYAEGLVGQVFLEKQEIYLSKIPNDYLSITSGLGDSNPQHLFICPLIDGDDVIGVLELASFYPFQTYQRALIKKLCENLASTVITTRINERTRSLLIATREQTEELMAQDEELRQNMEELQATQEELQRLLQEQESTMAAIDSASLSAEFSPDGEMLRVNDAFADFFGYQENELRGRLHKMLVHPASRESDEYKNLWERLRNGETISSDFHRIDKNGKSKWIRGTYYPIKNNKEQIMKILKIAYDITLEKRQQTELLETQQIIEQNQILLKERTKSIQDKAYERIKALKNEIATKDKIIEQFKEL